MQIKKSQVSASKKTEGERKEDQAKPSYSPGRREEEGKKSLSHDWVDSKGKKKKEDASYPSYLKKEGGGGDSPHAASRGTISKNEEGGT